MALGPTQEVLRNFLAISDMQPEYYASVSQNMKTEKSIWTDSLMISAYAASFSALVLLLQIILSTRPVRHLLSQLSSQKSRHSDDTEIVLVDDAPTPSAGIVSDLRSHIQSLGGSSIFFYKSLRLIGVLVLLGLTLVTLVQDEQQRPFSLLIETLKKRGKKHHKKKSLATFSPDEWLQIALCLTYCYATLLALISVSVKRRWGRVANSHLVLLLLVIFGVFSYRDVWPLATFDKQPADIVEGALIWAKYLVLTVTAIIVPLLIPRPYVPFDPKEPAAEPNPEQTTSLLSLALYFFLDPIIFKAYRVPHLSADEFPPLADYDYSKNLVKRSFKHLDKFQGAGKAHLFFGLMKVFYREYIGIFLMTLLKVITMFASPIGINRLLFYLENNGEGSTIRPWVWILWLFLGPVVGTIGMQWYIFLTTGTLVRTEGIITQLIFEHALRIRVKAQTDSENSPSSPSTAAPTPDTASIAESAVSEEGATASTVNGGETSVAESETVRASSSSISSKGKGKKANGKDSKDPEEPASKSSTDNLVGKLNNLVTTDLQNIVEGRDFMLLCVFSPLIIGLGVWFLYEILGWSALIGMLVMLLAFPLPGYVAKIIQSTQIERMKKTDSRVQLVSETMNVIRMIKLFGWEPKVNDEIAKKRDDELKWIKRRQLLDLLNGNINYIIPLLTMICTFSTYTLVMKRTLTASTVFSAMAVLDMLRDQLHMTFFMIPAVIQAKVSIDRVSEFLNDTELLDQFESKANEEVESIAGHPENPEVIGFRDATFAWSSDVDGSLTPSRRNFRLFIEDELTFKRGCINLIIGPTGSGKTSLIMALLGEMHFIPSGPTSWYNLPRSKGVAYAAQESWVQNETIRDNILFGSPYDEERYNKVIYQCGLERDLTLFEAGDLTEVGEKGLTLSGGQKARVTLARAIYSRAEIILLDDVLAALDVHTARWIVNKCFLGDLVKGRTLLLVTHNVALASPVASFVVSLGTNGRVANKGTPSQLLLTDKEMQEEIEESKEENKKEDEVIDEDDVKKGDKKDGKLVLSEEIAEGHVSWNALKLYLFNLGGPLFWILFLGGILLCDVMSVFQTWFLGYWASQYDTHDPADVSVPRFLGVFALIILIGVIAYCFAYFLYTLGSIRASRTIHKRLIESIIGTTLRWLDSTPTGRVIARCTQDIRAVDGPVSQNLGWLIEITLYVFTRFAAVVIFTPLFVFPGFLVGALGSWCGQIYIKAQLSVKREMSNAKSPLLSHFGAAIAGLVSIRAYDAQGSFKKVSLDRIDRYVRSARTFYNLNRWVCVRIDALGGFFAAGLAAYLVYGNTGLNPSNVGFSLNMAVAFSSIILWWVRTLNEFEVSGNSLERIQEYIDIEQEPKPTPDGIPPAYWPSSGGLRVEKLCARYSKEGPEVLHDITFEVNSGERVGIVGRTGSGKSSLTLSLLRCIVTEGDVYYDSLPTNKVNLDMLRRNITIIPQVPELLSGTLRHNLDPFEEHDDAVLNDALRSAGLFSLQKDDDEGRLTLDSQIASGGTNLSVGQRQILALARAIVRGSKLLILDEATSAIDYATDTVIQKSLRSELGGDVTILTVAHRLQTIMDSDKILVLDAGRVVEFDSPQNLLKREGGMLKALVDASGDREMLYKLAGVQ